MVICQNRKVWRFVDTEVEISCRSKEFFSFSKGSTMCIHQLMHILSCYKRASSYLSVHGRRRDGNQEHTKG